MSQVDEGKLWTTRTSMDEVKCTVHINKTKVRISIPSALQDLMKKKLLGINTSIYKWLN